MQKNELKNINPAYQGMKSKSFVGLLIAQFLSAFNDQALHAAAMFFAINTQTMNERDAISLMPILFYAPWAIFCTLAGWAADRYSKRNSLIVWKCSEIIFCTMTLIGFWLGSNGNQIGPWLVLGCVFFMGMHAAFFGPAKYGIMPEMIPNHELSKANGLLESLSFMGTIIGTVTGGILSYLFLGQEVWIGVILLISSFVGVAGSLLIRYVPPANPSQPFPKYIYGPLGQSLRLMWSNPPLRIAIVGIAFFTFVVAFMRASVYMLGESQNPRWDELKTSAVVGTVALGIGLGSPIAGWLSGKTIRPKIILLGALGMAISCLIGAAFITDIPKLILSIIGIGFFTGFYLVPLFTMLQRSAPKTAKGEMVAVSNFVDVSGAILASVLFFGVVTIAQKTGWVPKVVDHAEVVTGQLAELNIERGRPTAFVIKTETDRYQIGQLKQQLKSITFSDLITKIFGNSGSPTMIDIEKETLLKFQNDSEKPTVTVHSHHVSDVVHYSILLKGQPVKPAYDQRALPRYLFIGAAAIVLIAFAWLIKPVFQLKFKSPRFAILLHDWPTAHFDFLIENGDSCLTWRVKNFPESDIQQMVEKLPDHRVHYLTYEGEVTGQRGKVVQKDAGEIEWIEQSEKAIAVKLKGRALNGTAVLETSATTSNEWSLLFTRNSTSTAS